MIYTTMYVSVFMRVLASQVFHDEKANECKNIQQPQMTKILQGSHSVRHCTLVSRSCIEMLHEEIHIREGEISVSGCWVLVYFGIEVVTFLSWYLLFVDGYIALVLNIIHPTGWDVMLLSCVWLVD